MVMINEAKDSNVAKRWKLGGVLVVLPPRCSTVNDISDAENMYLESVSGISSL